MTDIQQYASRGIAAELLIGQKLVPVNRVLISHSINQLPVAQVTLQLDNQKDQGGVGSVDILPHKFAQLFQLLQDKIMIEYRLEPDCLLTLTDGNGTKIRFPSLMGQPKFGLLEGQLELSVGLVHAKAALQAFNPQIYDLHEHYVLPFMAPAFGTEASSKAQTALKSKSVALKCFAILEWLVNHPVYEPEIFEPNQYTAMPIHNLNKRAWKLVSEVLLASEKTTEIPGLDSEDFFHENLIRNLWITFLNSGPFTNTLPAICEMFMLQMNSDYRGNLWLEHIRYLEDPGQRFIKVPTSEISFTCAHLYTLPVLQVIVLGSANDFYLQAGVTGTERGQAPPTPIKTPAGEVFANEIFAGNGDLWVKSNALARYPPNVAHNSVGNFYTITAPAWLNPSLMHDDQLTKLAADLKREATDKSRNELRVNEQIKITEGYKGFQLPRNEVLKYLAKMYYQELQLGGTSAAVVTALDFRPLPGRTYLIYSMDDEPLFIGFLSEVRHVMDPRPEGGTASTTLLFSHVRMVNSKLPEAKIFLKDINTGKANGVAQSTFGLTDRTWEFNIGPTTSRITDPERFGGLA